MFHEKKPAVSWGIPHDYPHFLPSTAQRPMGMERPRVKTAGTRPTKAPTVPPPRALLGATEPSAQKVGPGTLGVKKTCKERG